MQNDSQTTHQDDIQCNKTTEVQFKVEVTQTNALSGEQWA